MSCAYIDFIKVQEKTQKMKIVKGNDIENQLSYSNEIEL